MPISQCRHTKGETHSSGIANECDPPIEEITLEGEEWRNFLVACSRIIFIVSWVQCISNLLVLFEADVKVCWRLDVMV